MQNYNVQNQDDQFKFNQNFTMPSNYQDVAKQAYTAAVSPLEESFSRQRKDIENTLAQRGIAFGGAGNSVRGDLYRNQAATLGNISAQIGSALGQSAIDKAYQQAEAAKSRQFQTGERIGTQQFQIGERLGSQGFQSSENKLSRDLQNALQMSAQKFESGESALTRDSQKAQLKLQYALQNGIDPVTGQPVSSADIEKMRMEAQQGFQSEQSSLDRALQLSLQKSGQDFQASESELARNSQQAQLKLQYALQNGIDPTTGEPVSSADVQRLQSEASQAFQENQSALDRALQKSLQSAGFTQQTDMAKMQNEETLKQMAIQRGYSKEDSNIQAVMNGLIDKDSEEGKKIIESAFGAGAKVNTLSEAAILNKATEMGLSPTEYATLRKTMGKRQMNTIIENVDAFIYDPTAEQMSAIADGLLATGDTKKTEAALDIYLKTGVFNEEQTNQIKEALGIEKTTSTTKRQKGGRFDFPLPIK